MPAYTVTSYLYVGMGKAGKPTEMNIKDDDDRADWFGAETGDKETAEIDGESHVVQGTGVYKITYQTQDGEEITEDMVFSYVSNVGWMMAPSEDSKFETGSHITKLHGWQEYGTEYKTFTCFVSGTLIQTASGPRFVETLKAGDLILTLDHGAQPVLWAGTSRMDMVNQVLRPRNRPIVFPVGALGIDAQSSELSVSSPHRILLTGGDLELFFGIDQAFAPANALVGLNGIHRAPPQRNLTYHHIMLPQHEVILAHRIPSESFFPGGQALHALSKKARLDLFQTFPELAADPSVYGKTARLCLTNREAQALQIVTQHAIA